MKFDFDKMLTDFAAVRFALGDVVGIVAKGDCLACDIVASLLNEKWKVENSPSPQTALR